MNWHLQTIETSLDALQSQPDTGLSQDEAARRLAQYGPNELVEKGGRTPLKIFWEQITATMVLILIAAAVVAGLLGDLKNTIAISAIVILYAILGFIQEYRAERAIEALRQMAAPTATVLRDGDEREIPARDLVPGDVILIRAGDRIPADARLVESINLQIEEAALTGESVPVMKRALEAGETTAAPPPPGGDGLAYAYSGTLAVRGNAVAAAGMAIAIAATLLEKGMENWPLLILGMTIGTVTVQKVRQREEPRFCPASSTEMSTALNAATVGKTTKGNKVMAKTMVSPVMP